MPSPYIPVASAWVSHGPVNNYQVALNQQERLAMHDFYTGHGVVQWVAH